MSPETIQFLRGFVQSQREAADLLRLQKDPEMVSSINYYEQDLSSFLAQPETLAFGCRLQEENALLGSRYLRHSEQVAELDQRIAFITQERSETFEHRRLVEGRISSIGKKDEPVKPGDFRLVLGRIQTELWRMQQAGRLSLLGRLLTIVIHPTRTHKDILPLDSEIDASSHQLDLLLNTRRQDREAYLAQITKEEEVAGRLKEEFLSQLDRWASKHLDRCLVHVLLHSDRRWATLRHFRTVHEEDWPEMLDKLSALLPAEFGRFPGEERAPRVNNGVETVTQKRQEVPEIEGILPMKLIINGQSIDNVEAAKDAFFELAERFPSTIIKKQLFEKLVRTLFLRSEGLRPSGFKLLRRNDRRIDLVGGESRIRVGRYRIITNDVTSPDGETMMEVVKVLHREDPRYFKE